MNTVIIYESKHHGNTKKVCERISEVCGVTLVEAHSVTDVFPWERYELVGFASGLLYGKFYEQVNLAAQKLPQGKPVFFLYTCAGNSKDFSSDIQSIAGRRRAVWLGSFGCKGFNTYGPLRLIGGMNRANPTEDELQAAVEFYRGVEAKLEALHCSTLPE